MATKKVKLSAPSEFSSKPKQSPPKNPGIKNKSDNQLLVPPSKYTANTEIKERAFQNKHQDTEERKNQKVLNDEIVKIKSTSAELLNEIKKCKKQNSVLEENLTKQMKEYLKKNGERSNPPDDHPKLSGVYAELKKSQQESGMFHASLQRQIEKQAETIEKLTGNYFERQNDLITENEKLRTRLYRLTEEHKEMKSYLEKEVELRETSRFNLLSDLRKSNQVIENMSESIDQERKEFSIAIKAMTEEISVLKSEVDNLAKQNIKLVENKKEEIEKVTGQYNEERMVLKRELEAKSAELKSYKKKYKESVSKGNDRFNAVENDFKRVKVENESMKQELGENKEKFEKFKRKADEETITNLAILNDLKRKIESKESSNNAELAKAHEQHIERMQKEVVVSKELRANLEKQSNQLKNAQEEIEKLHAHISEMTNDRNTKKYESQLDQMRNEKLQLSEACRSLESANELLNVRLISLNNVIKIQEAEVSKDGIAFAGEKTASLLNKWRDKVYALLVQLKSQQIMENEDFRNLEKKLKVYQDEISDNKSKVALLSNQLREKTAEVEMISNRVEQMTKDRDSLLKRESQLDDLVTSYEKCIFELCKKLESASSSIDNNVDRFNRGMTSLKALESRVNFAKERLRTMEELLARREVLWNSKLDEVRKKQTTDNEQTEICEVSQDVLSREVQNLTNERQILLNQIKKDTEELSRIKSDLNAEYRGKLETRDQRIEELEQEEQCQRVRVNEMEMEICHLRKSKEQIEEELEALKFDVQRNQAGYEKETKKEEDRRAYQDELAKKDMIIDEAQREHTKTIVSLRQMERQLAWQKQNSTDLVKENNEMHKLELEKLNKKAAELEKERNLLLTTIKQENIKVPRMRPVVLDSSSEPENQHEERYVRAKTLHENTTNDQKSKRKKSKPKNVKSSNKFAGMLRELENISSALLQDDTQINSPKNVDTDEQKENSISSEL